MDGANVLIFSLRKLFSNFGLWCTVEVSSEFKAKSIQEFLKRWGVRLSSSYMTTSNGRAELAVKYTKRFLMNLKDDNDLDNNKINSSLVNEVQHSRL